MIHRVRRVVLTFALCALAAPLSARQQDMPEAQRRLDDVRRQLEQVASERREIEGRRGEASRQLRAVDEQVATSSRALDDARNQLAHEQAALEQLTLRRDTLTREQAAQRRELAALLRAAYAQGDPAPLKLLLAQDRIADANRQLTYFGYLQRQRVQRAAALTAELQELQRVEAQIIEKRSALDTARQRQQATLVALQRDRQARSLTLGELEQRYRDREARERALGSDAQALQTLIARLREAAARAAAERAAAERAAAAEQARQAAAKNRAGGHAQSASHAPRQVASAPPVRVGGAGWPLSGQLLAGYGGRMPDGRGSSGLLIAAATGSPVHAVADGTVVFAEWMTGYGLILIVDHGNGYLSLYAHNETLLRNVGDAVHRGDTVARVGNSGGLTQPALYFELRRNGQPVDPNTWLRRQ